jgi:serine/threonine protein kinase
MAFSVENICGFLIRSRLLTPDEVKAMYQRWLGEAQGAAGDVGKLIRWLVANQYLTDFQAGFVARGQVDNFFLGPYKVLSPLGQGRMAAVYKAVHDLGQIVAIKVLPPSRAKEGHVLSRFQREARLALRLQHPHVVRTFQIGDSDGMHYLVMQFLDGENLDGVLKRRGKLPPAEAARVIHQALLGLQYLHEQGLIHRDLKPANLMLVPSRQPGQPDSTLGATVKILDIGMGRAVFDGSLAAEGEDTNLTGEGVVMGTPDYLAPEQARSARTADIRADVYSLGCVLYHVLSGQPPFPDRNLINQIYRHATETPRPLREFNSGIPDGVQQVVNGMMAKDPARRYPTPERAAQALQGFLPTEAEQVRRSEAEPPLPSYVNWLEKESRREVEVEAAGPPAAVATLPVSPLVRPASSTPAMGKLVSARESPVKPGAAHTRKRTRKPRLLPDTAPTSDATVELDVELVTAPMPGASLVKVRGLELSRRDLVMMAIGAVGAVGAALLGMLAARMGRQPPTPPPGMSGE